MATRNHQTMIVTIESEELRLVIDTALEISRRANDNPRIREVLERYDRIEDFNRKLVNAENKPIVPGEPFDKSKIELILRPSELLNQFLADLLKVASQ